MGEVIESLRQVAYRAIDRERAYQDRKWGPVDPKKRKALSTWLSIAAEELHEAWNALEAEDEEHGHGAVLRESVQCAAVLIAMMEEYGVVDGHEQESDGG